MLAARAPQAKRTHKRSMALERSVKNNWMARYSFRRGSRKFSQGGGPKIQNSFIHHFTEGEESVPISEAGHHQPGCETPFWWADDSAW